MGNINIPITAIVKKGKAKLFPQGDCPSCAPKVSPAGWPMKESPIKHVNKFMDENHQHNKNHDERPLHSHKNFEQKKKKKASPSNTESPVKDIDNFRSDRRDYEKSKYKKGSSPVKQMSKVLKAPCPTCGKMMGKCKNCGN
tara:strand:+ start:149 stop:571 length:423 start_codon:yes stop_codon:yes gene_type:complete